MFGVPVVIVLLIVLALVILLLLGGCILFYAEEDHSKRHPCPTEVFSDTIPPRMGKSRAIEHAWQNKVGKAL